MRSVDLIYVSEYHFGTHFCANIGITKNQRAVSGSWGGYALTEWATLIREAADERPEPLIATAILDVWPQRGSTPFKVTATDGNQYVAKGLWRGRDRGRAIAIDYIVSRLGQLLGAPVAEVAIINVPDDMVAGCSELTGMVPGPVRGSHWIDGCRDFRRELADCDFDSNQQELALIALMFGWVVDDNMLGDVHFLCCGSAPRKIVSMDHDVFWQSLPFWNDTRERLFEPDKVLATVWSPGPARPNMPILRHLRGDKHVSTIPEIPILREALEGVTELEVANVIALVPDEWGITPSVQIELANYLWMRRDDLLQWCLGPR